MSYKVGDIVELSDFGLLLWEVVRGVYYEHNNIRPCIRVVYWGCPPEVTLSDYVTTPLPKGRGF